MLDVWLAAAVEEIRWAGKLRSRSERIVLLIILQVFARLLCVVIIVPDFVTKCLEFQTP